MSLAVMLAGAMFGLSRAQIARFALSVSVLAWVTMQMAMTMALMGASGDGA
jgi:hypothetical protein